MIPMYMYLKFKKKEHEKIYFISTAKSIEIHIKVTKFIYDITIYILPLI